MVLSGCSEMPNNHSALIENIQSINKRYIYEKIFMILALMSCVVLGCQAQRKKPILKTTKDSTIVDKSMIKDAKMTKYFYTTADKTKYPIYMSSDGKCFIIRTS